MKNDKQLTFLPKYTAVILAFAAGGAGGWLAHSNLGGLKETPGGAGQKAVPNPPENERAEAPPQPETKPTKPTNTPSDSIQSKIDEAVAFAMQENEKLDPVDFGKKLAALCTGKRTIRDRAEEDGMKKLLNPERFLEFYTAYAKKVRIEDGDPHLRHYGCGPALGTSAQGEFGKLEVR